MTTENTAAVTALLASAFKLLFLDNGAAQRGADNTARYLATAPILDSDPLETRVVSESKPGTTYITDGVYCTCPGGQHREFCKHRIAHRFALAQLALTDPALLVRLIVEQAAPANAGEAELAAVGRAAEIIAGLPLDPADDGAYLDRIIAEADRGTASQAEREFLELYP